MIKDYYKTLELVFPSTQNEIKKSFRKLAIFWHPDRNGNPNSLKKMQEINEAYQILSDQTRKTSYDKIYRDLFDLNTYLVVAEKKEDTGNNNFNNNFESTNNREDKIRKNYAAELADLNEWVSNIKFSLEGIDKLLDKILWKLDKPIENIAYYLPIILVIVVVTIIVLINIVK